MLTVECSPLKIAKFPNVLLEYSCYLIMLIHKDLGGLLALPYQNLILMIFMSGATHFRKAKFFASLYIL